MSVQRYTSEFSSDVDFGPEKQTFGADSLKLINGSYTPRCCGNVGTEIIISQSIFH